MIQANITPSNRLNTLEAFMKYLRLSNVLFNNKREEIYNVTDLKETSEFFQIMKDKAQKLKIDWNKMTHGQSNRIMLAVLEDSFNNIRDIEESESVLLKLKLVVNEANKR